MSPSSQLTCHSLSSSPSSISGSSSARPNDENPELIYNKRSTVEPLVTVEPTMVTVESTVEPMVMVESPAEINYNERPTVEPVINNNVCLHGKSKADIVSETIITSSVDMGFINDHHNSGADTQTEYLVGSNMQLISPISDSGLANQNELLPDYIGSNSSNAVSHSMITHSTTVVKKPNPRYALLTDSIPCEPRCIIDALSDEGWKAAMETEIAALKTNKTWVLVPRESDMNFVGCRWVYKTKLQSDGGTWSPCDTVRLFSAAAC
ncbi:hypothetical protein NE237_011540 [Protea cynaroides]|uniref:Mitochondrial protein n=1 Tax=Protea cynaroides TaxID=273540 RepID=A0A9Q0GV52_9MAGN|nr:hypothetical protein NE237_011540 [Protea cynaroides]